MALTQREKRHSKMFEPKFTISNSITKALLEIERARGFLDAAKLKEAWRKERDVLYYTPKLLE